MPRVAFVIPGDLNLPTGGYAYDRRVLALLPKSGVDATHLALPGSYPAPPPADLDATRRLIAATSPLDILLIDGLAYGAMPAEIVRKFDRRIIALVHHPLCLEAGLTPARAAELKALETQALSLADHIVATSPTTARTLIQDFNVSAEILSVAEPGTDPAPRSTGSRSARSGAEPLRLLAVGSLIPRKGYDVLIEALAPLKALSWRLDIAGATDRSPQTVTEVKALIVRHGLAGRVALLGPVGDVALGELYANADVFVMASHYEGYGMVLTEALARGLPIVCTTGGAAAETVPDGAALKVEPGSARALAWTLGRAIDDANIRKGLADAAWDAGQRLTRWEDTARRIAQAVEQVAR